MTNETVDVETGEISAELASDPEERLAQLIRARHDAYEQMRGWERRKQALDALILPLMPEGRVEADGIVCRVAGRTTTRLDAGGFAEALERAETSRPELLSIVAATTGLRLDAIPEVTGSGGEFVGLREFAGRFLERVPSAKWIETSVSLRRAPAEEVR